ncbi:hypothetical protein NQZ68_036528, partial [Dissostichus eleginoides]
MAKAAPSEARQGPSRVDGPDSLTQGAALPDAPLWMAGARHSGASPVPSYSLPPSWVPMQGPNDLGTACPADGGCSRGLPYTRYRCCLMAGPVEATGQGMCCFQVVD